MVKLGEQVTTELVDKIYASTHFDTVSMSPVVNNQIEATIIHQGSLLNVTARVVGMGETPPSESNRADVFTITCGIDINTGTNIGSGWRYQVPHPFGSTDFIVSVIEGGTNIEQHVALIKTTTHAVITLSNQATTCYNVTVIGHVD